MIEALTAGALRALDRAQARARRRGAAEVGPLDLLAALADDPEGRAAALLAAAGADAGPLAAAFDDADERGAPAAGDEAMPPPVLGAAVRVVVADALERARAADRAAEVGTEHLLAALAAAPGAARDRLFDLGLAPDALVDPLARQARAETAPIPLAPEIPPLELATPGDGADLARILDASANRAREGLRVVEDYVRFALEDPGLSRRLKDCRHRLGRATAALEADGRLLAARDTPGDVGTHIMTAAERQRENPRAVLAANFKRLGEALRSLEEYTKLVDPWLAGRFEVLRYDAYTLEKLVTAAAAALHDLADARLYLLAGGDGDDRELAWLVAEALAGGVQVVQLRDKRLADRDRLRRAEAVRTLTRQARARFVLNDRPDLALLAGADGVHLGQDDLAVRDARRIVGPSALVGVSTHDPDQLERAVADAAGYLGVGPVFASGTKAFEPAALAGLGFVSHAAGATGLPWFAIGGIDEGNLDAVLAAGARRVAVAGAIARAERPRQAAQALRDRLDAAAG